MKVDFHSQLAISHLPNNAGYQAIILALRARVQDVEQQLSVPQKDWHEDIRLLQLWRGMKHSLDFLENLPREIGQKIDENVRNGDPTAVPFVGSADEMDTEYIKAALKGMYPTKPPPVF